MVPPKKTGVRQASGGKIIKRMHCNLAVFRCGRDLVKRGEGDLHDGYPVHLGDFNGYIKSALRCFNLDSPDRTIGFKHLFRLIADLTDCISFLLR